MPSRLARGTRASLALLLQLLAAAPLLAATPPAGFTDALVANLSSPTALAFTPDGRLLLTQQTGQLRVYQNGALAANPAFDFNAGNRICSDFERGLLGVAVDPLFAANHYIYLYYTFNKHSAPDRNSCTRNTTNPSTDPVNRVSRFILSDANVASAETVIVDNIPSPNGNHNAGDLHFGKDGYLYISIGEGGVNANARRLDLLSGKILRVDRDGAAPAANPLAGAAGARRCGHPGGVPAGNGPCSEMFAWGLRNPFRMAFDPNAAGTRFLINDVGQNAWEEIDEGQIGADYGWNCREGKHAHSSTGACTPTPPGMVDPIYEYGRDTGCYSITGAAFVPAGIWPAPYDRAYLFADYGCGKIFRLVPGSGNSYAAAEFITGAGGAVAMAFGPYNGTQALYYAMSGQIRRVFYTASANRSPSAVIAATPSSGPAPLTVSFDSAGSSDPDGDTLSFDWDFGDGSAHATTPAATHQYAPGTYTATLRVSDGKGGVGAATVRIDSGNTAPQPVISAPAPSLRYRVGQQITIQGSASDAEDTTPPALSWRVILHHNTHTHPFLPPTPGSAVSITTLPPEDLAAASTSYLEIELTASDSKGLTGVITQALRPHLVDITFASVPAGRQLLVNGEIVTTTQTLTSWEAYTLNVSAPLQKDSAGQWLALAAWADGGPVPTRAIVTPAAAATYTASFAPARLWRVPLMRR
jgi:glucose/arabinose dehydrogenase/PKD repeat protein